MDLKLKVSLISTAVIILLIILVVLLLIFKNNNDPPYTSFDFTESYNDYIIKDNLKFFISDNTVISDIEDNDILYTFTSTQDTTRIAIIRNDKENPYYDEIGSYLFVTVNDSNNIVTYTSSDTMDLSASDSYWNATSTASSSDLYDYAFEFSNLV
tara:strand:- start:470 stop:934 length:465 start_codon:yes stop_codon:yes gene_type:complete